MSLFKKHITQFNDEELMIKMSSSRRNEALTELYERYASRILGYYINMFQGDIQKAQDFTQDVFIRISDRHEQFDGTKSFYTWLFTIASNYGKSSFRNKVIQVDFTPKNETQIEQDSIDQQLFAKELQKAIQSLSTKHREIYILRYIEQLTVPEISNVVKLPLGTIKSRLFYANKLIVEALKEFDPKREYYGKTK